MSDVIELTPAAIRAALAERRILKYEFANRVGVHPQRLGAVLNERASLTPALAERIQSALDADAAERESAASDNQRRAQGSTGRRT